LETLPAIVGNVSNFLKPCHRLSATFLLFGNLASNFGSRFQLFETLPTIREAVSTFRDKPDTDEKLLF